MTDIFTSPPWKRWKGRSFQSMFEITPFKNCRLRNPWRCVNPFGFTRGILRQSVDYPLFKNCVLQCKLWFLQIYWQEKKLCVSALESQSQWISEPCIQCRSLAREVICSNHPPWPHQSTIPITWINISLTCDKLITLQPLVLWPWMIWKTNIWTCYLSCKAPILVIMQRTATFILTLNSCVGTGQVIIKMTN